MERWENIINNKIFQVADIGVDYIDFDVAELKLPTPINFKGVKNKIVQNHPY